MIFWYKNSFWASVVSIFGCLFIFGGISTFSDDAVVAVVIILLGVALAVWGKIISKNKAFKVWWKQIDEKNLAPEIARNVEFAKMVYSKNPCKNTLKKIAQLNPAAAEQIAATNAAKKNAKKI